MSCAAPIAPTIEWTRFAWGSDTIGGGVLPHSAILVPVELDGVPGRQRLQLDTGSGWPLLYAQPYRQLAGPLPSGAPLRAAAALAEAVTPAPAARSGPPPS